MYWSTGESGTSSSHQCPERAAFILSFRFRLFTLSFSFFDIVPCGEHGVGASSIADPSESPFFSSPSSSLGVSARFVPTVLPLGTAQRGEGRAEGGCPEEDPEWEGRGGGEGETVATAMEGSTNACVDTSEGVCEEEGEGGGGVAALEGREAVGKPVRGRSGAAGGGEGRERERGRGGEVAMSTSSGMEGLMEVVVDCCSLMEEGGAADP